MEPEFAALLATLLLVVTSLLMVEHDELSARAARADARSDKRAKRAQRKLRKRKRPEEALPPGERRPAGTGKRQVRGRAHLLENTDVDIHHDTGLLAAEFEYVFSLVDERLSTAPLASPNASFCQSNFTSRSILYIVLRWLRHYDSLVELAHKFGGSAASMSRLINGALPILYVALRDQIHWPDGNVPSVFGDCVGAIDCTSHLRWRVHPHSCEYYRGDVHQHFLTAQLICGVTGPLWDVQLGLGHNNDQTMFNVTGVREELFRREQRLLADSGYTGFSLVTPGDITMAGLGPQFRKQHAGFRSVVEQNFAYVHMFMAAGGVFRQSPELQQLALLVIYSLVFIKFRDTPLRTIPAAV